MPSSPSKTDLRRSLLTARQAIPPAQWRQNSDRLCSHLKTWAAFEQAQTVLAYFSFRQEPDLSPLFVLPKQWGFPRCVGKELTWHQWSPPGSPPESPLGSDLATIYPLQTGAYGIVEPHPDAPTLHPDAVDLILVPAVACDQQGYRLGYGGGFYDRLLSQPAWASKTTVGIIFQDAYLSRLPHDPWDQPLQAIGTEAGITVPQNR